MKKNIIMFILAILLFIACPFIARYAMAKEAGIIVTIFMLLVIYPVFFIANGLISIANMKKNWYTTFVFTVIFTVSYAIIIDMKEPFYIFIYLGLGYITMIGGMLVKKIQKKRG